MVGPSLARACDDRIILNEQPLRLALRWKAFVPYDNGERPHRSPGLETPWPAARMDAGPVRSRPVLGRLHHAYERVG